jgi:small subunit ribosomal protein S19
MSLEEFTDLVPSRERRTLTRMNDELKLIIEKTRKKEKIKTHHREMIVVPHMIGKVVAVHNGKEFVEVHIVPEMVGLRFGQLVLTRKRVSHSGPGVGATKSSSAATAR